MNIRLSRYRNLLFLFLFLLTSCRIPRIPIKQSAKFIEEFKINDCLIKKYTVAKYTKTDSLNKILKYEYLPKDIYIVSTKNDSSKYILVCAWQEYLWRLSEKLSNVDKPYYSPILNLFNTSLDSINIVWMYPNLDDRDKDLRNSNKKRNNYWSIDLFTSGKPIIEKYNTTQTSYPVENMYNPLDRFTESGTYIRSMIDTNLINNSFKNVLNDFTILISKKSNIEKSNSSQNK